MSLLDTINNKKIVNTLVYYLGGSWAVLEATGFFKDQYNISYNLVGLVLIVLGFGLPAVLIFQWFRGDDLGKRITSKEALGYFFLTTGLIYSLYLVDVNPEPTKAKDIEIVQGSIAVLPFQKIGDGDIKDYYGDGFADDIISMLSKASGLTVISRISSFQFRDTNRSIQNIRDQLKVENVLEGSYRIMNDKIRLNVNLVYTETGENVWSDSFTGDLTDIFDLQNNVAQKVANSLQKELVLNTDSKKVDILAYEYYRKGVDLLRQKYISKSVLDESLNALNQSIEIDSMFGDAYLAKAEAGLTFIYWGYGPYSSISNQILDAVEKAKQLGVDEGDIFAVLSTLSLYNYELDNAKILKEKALNINPNSILANWVECRLGLFQGNSDRAINAMDKIIELDPLTGYRLIDKYWLMAHMGMHDQSIKLLNEHLNRSPDDNYARWALAYAHIQKGAYNKGIEILKARTVSTKDLNWALGYALGKTGQKEEAQRIADYLIEKKTNGTFVPSFQIAYVYLGIGDLEETFKWLEQEYDERGGWLGFLVNDKVFVDLKDDPRYKGLIARINIPK